MNENDKKGITYNKESTLVLLTVRSCAVLELKTFTLFGIGYDVGCWMKDEGYWI